MNPETGEIRNCDKYYSKSPIHLAVLHNSPTECEELILSGEDVNILFDGLTPLHLACKMGKVQVAQLLLSYKCDVNAETITCKYTPLHIASSAGHSQLNDLLIRSGADVNKPDNKGVNALWVAAQDGHASAVESLLRHGVNANQTNEYGISPIALTAFNGNSEVAKLLVDSGCDVDIADMNGNTPLLHAVKGGQREVTKILVQAGACVNRGNQAGKYAIHIASLHGNVDIIETLIGANCDVNVTIAGVTPIFYAVQRQHFYAVQKLIRAGANLDAFDEQGFTPPPLIEATRHPKPNLKLICSLIQGGCNVSEPSILFNTCPLQYALMNGQKEVAMLLIQADCAPLSATDIVNCSYRAHMDDKLYNTVIHHMQTPFSLLRLTRNTIRRSLGYGQHYARKVNQLEIPETLKKFIMFSEISEDSPANLLLGHF